MNSSRLLAPVAAACIAGLVFGIILHFRPAGDESAIVADWTLVPDYRLPKQGANQPGPRIPLPFGTNNGLIIVPPPVQHAGELPTDRWHPTAETTKLTNAFSVECCLTVLRQKG